MEIGDESLLSPTLFPKGEGISSPSLRGD